MIEFLGVRDDSTKSIVERFRLTSGTRQGNQSSCHDNREGAVVNAMTVCWDALLYLRCGQAAAYVFRWFAVGF